MTLAFFLSNGGTVVDVALGERLGSCWTGRLVGRVRAVAASSARHRNVA